ncbi:hypothetical protein [Streptantibioticus cattleyicolor]|uniref:Uncharacterized protein n=1 Tax=Streptantibioticus cattleyicolor (strain ATCC 35852 / DSM 46488 / JCM 4925 / NBRC 14057 / NRRL 8057) TaxID=1003195 RepID=F8JNB1_STREN
MLDEAFTALAAAGGTAVVTAVGTDTWGGMRQAVARWFGRGDTVRERAEAERLEQTAALLRATEGTAGAEQERTRQSAWWQSRIESALEELDEAERAWAAVRLRAVLTEHARPDGTATRPRSA